jgi:hypothetical protein
LNTYFGYRYTDKTNCKQYKGVVLEGTITWEQIEPYLANRGFFIPGQVGLEDLQHRFALAGFDHPWHQILPEDLRTTEREPTATFNADELARRFASVVWAPDLQSASLSSLKSAQSVASGVLAGKISTLLSTPEEEQAASRRWPGSRTAKKSTARKKD